MSLTWDVLERERLFASSFARAAIDGIDLDREQIERLIGEQNAVRKGAQERVEAATGGAVRNPKSSLQVGEFLAATGRYALPLTGRGRPSSAKGVLEPYAYRGDPLAADILEYRRCDTALGLLLRPRLALCELGDAKVRTSILTLQANTGRTSSRNENLQQVSRQGGMRACHRAAPGCLIVSADMASVEIRTGAALSGDSAMRSMISMGDAYPDRKKEFDFHWRTAIGVWGPDATKENRYTAKRINFQKMYGGAPQGCAAAVGIPLDDAERIFRAFSALAPEYEQWDQQMRAYAKAGGAVYKTYSGREIHLSGKGEHAAGNAAIQGTAREFLVDGVARWRKGRWGDSLIIPVHDEVIAFDIPQDEAADATAFLVECLENELHGVAIKAEANPPSPFWLDAS